MSQLILASNSAARQKMLRDAGYQFDVKPASIDERKLERDLLSEGIDHSEIAKSLAMQKAFNVSDRLSGDYIIGSDQILVFENNIMSKAMNREIALDRLKKMRGKTHHLISAVCVAQHAEIIFEHVAVASLTMHDFDDDFIARYADLAGDVLTSCVGSYALEGYGAQLFDTIDGDYFSILGMPLLPLMGFLREQGIEL